MDVTFDVPLSMVHELMDVICIEAGIRRQFVGEYFATSFHVRSHFFLQRMTLAIRDMLHADLAGLPIKQTHNQFFPSPARAVNLLRFLIGVHVAREAPDKGFVGFNWTARTELFKGTCLHREANTVKHKPT